MFRSATFKLTMWYLAIVMVISLSFSAVLYNAATGELSRSLHRQSARIYQQFPVFQNDPMLRPGDDLNNGEHRLLLRLIGFNLVVLGGAGFASYALARRTLEPIEEAHEQQKRFTADVSHELRTPLTVIKSESEVALMNAKNKSQDLRQVLRSNLEEATKLEALINNLLRLTRLEAGELQQNFTLLSTASIAEEALRQVQKTADEHHVKLENTVNDLPLSGDNDSLIQLLVILLDNAIKYSPKKTTVTLSGQLVEDHIVLSVKDQGIGIDREALEHVFDRFYRADNSRLKTNAEGFGLGLSIAKMIADIHDSTITLSSSPGHGTTATVSLPASTPKDTSS